MGERAIPAMESVFARNEQLARELRDGFTKSGTFAVNVMGAPGVGKTSVLSGIIRRLGVQNCFVIEGDIKSDIDTQKLAALGISARQINTAGACHLDCPLVADALQDWEPLNYLFIENIGNLVCPAEFMIGEHLKMLICSVADGSDKPYKYPLAFEKAGVIVLNKTDLLPYVAFDEEFFMRGVRALNPEAQVVRLSAVKEEGLDELASCVKELAAWYIGK